MQADAGPALRNKIQTDSTAGVRSEPEPCKLTPAACTTCVTRQTVQPCMHHFPGSWRGVSGCNGIISKYKKPIVQQPYIQGTLSTRPHRTVSLGPGAARAVRNHYDPLDRNATPSPKNERREPFFIPVADFTDAYMNPGRRVQDLSISSFPVLSRGASHNSSVRIHMNQ